MKKIKTKKEVCCDSIPPKYNKIVRKSFGFEIPYCI